MAKFLNTIPTNLTEYPNSFKRQGAFPLEAYSVFYTKDEAETYAQSNPLAYVGQTIAVVTSENDAIKDVTLYVIDNEAGNLKEVGATPVGDNKSVEVVNKVIQLHDFGTKYYKYNTEYAKDNTQPKYILMEGWVENLSPKVVKNGETYELAWYEPDPSTIDGLQKDVEALQKAIGDADTEGSLRYDLEELSQAHNTLNDQINGEGEDALATRVVALEVAVGPDGQSGLTKDVAGLKTTVGDANSGLVKVVGDANSGLVKDVADLKDAVGDASKGLIKDVKNIQGALDESVEGTFANRLKNAEGVLADHGTRIGDLEDAVGDASEGLVKDVTDLKDTVGDASKGLVKDVNALETAVGDANSGLVKDVNALETTVGDSASGLVKDVNDLKTKVGDENSGLTQEVAEIKEDLTNANVDGSTAAKIKELQQAVGLIEGKEDGLIQEVSALQEDLKNANKEGSTANKIATLESLVGGLSTTGLSREIVTSLESVTDPKENVIYMVARPSSDWDKEKDVYDEYLYVKSTNTFELIGNTDVNLSNYYTKAEIKTQAETDGGVIYDAIESQINAVKEQEIAPIKSQVSTWAGTTEADKTKSIREIAVEVAQSNDYITSVSQEFVVAEKKLSLNEECVFILNGGNAAGYTIATDENELV